MRPVFRNVAAFVASIFLLSGCNGGTSSSEATVIGLTYVPNVQFSGVYLAVDSGKYSSQNLNVELRHHGNDEGVFTALLGGQEQVVLATGDEVVQARSQGLDVVSVATYYREQPNVILTREDTGIRRIADLRGKTIGIPGEYGSSWLALQAYLASAHMTTADVNVMSIGYTQTSALSKGDVDAIVGFANNEAVQLSAAGISVRAVDCDCAIPLVSASLVTTPQWAQEHSEQLKKLLQATQEGMSAAVQHPDQALKATEKRDSTLSDEKTRQIATQILNATNLLILGANSTVSVEQDSTRWNEMLTFMSSKPGLLHNSVKLDEVMMNDYVPGQAQ